MPVLSKILLTVLVLAAAGAALWGSGVFDPAQNGTSVTSDADLDASLRSKGAATKADDGSKGGDLEVEKAPESRSKSVAKNAGAGIGNTGKPPHGAAVFPDGTWLPPLNGVKVAPKFPGFAPGFPYAPVVKIVKGDKNVSWYIHADGSHSSTQLVETTQGGRTFKQAAWAVGNPTKTLPLDLPNGGKANGGDGNGFGPRATKAATGTTKNSR